MESQLHLGCFLPLDLTRLDVCNKGINGLEWCVAVLAYKFVPFWVRNQDMANEPAEQDLLITAGGSADYSRTGLFIPALANVCRFAVFCGQVMTC